MLDTPPPIPATTALLTACTEAITILRRAHGTLVAAVAELDRAEVHPECGHPSTSRLLEELLRLDRGQVRTLLNHARLLIAPEPDALHPDAAAPAPELPTTADAVIEGAIGTEHVEVIDHTLRRLRRVDHPPLPTAALDEAEHQLAALARERAPRQLADAATEIADRYDPDGTAPDDTDRPTEELRLAINRRGECTGRFRFADPETGQAVYDELAARTPPPDPDDHTTASRPGRTLPERHGEALRHLVDDAARARHTETDLDDLPCHECDRDPATPTTTAPGDNPTADPSDPANDPSDPANDPSDVTDATVVDFPGADTARPQRPARDPHRRADRPARDTTMLVTVPLEVLERRLTTPGQPTDLALIDGRYRVSAATARRLACDAAVIPAVLGAGGEVLDLGRKTRTVTTAQRRAVIARDRHCAFPGCRRSPRRCHVHHIVPWSHGGPTDLDHLVLLCHRHHHEIHHSPWSITMNHGHPTFIPPAYLDPDRRPRSNRGHITPSAA